MHACACVAPKALHAEHSFCPMSHLPACLNSNDGPALARESWKYKARLPIRTLAHRPLSRPHASHWVNSQQYQGKAININNRVKARFMQSLPKQAKASQNRLRQAKASKGRCVTPVLLSPLPAEHSRLRACRQP